MIQKKNLLTCIEATCQICIQEHQGSIDSNNGTATKNQTFEIKTEDGSDVPIDTPYMPGRLSYLNKGECFSFPQTQLETCSLCLNRIAQMAVDTD